jgi:hypothetical protein
MNKSVRIGSLVVSCALAGAAFAQATSPAGSPSTGAGAQGMGVAHEFTSIDTNKDGKVSSTEAQSNTELRSAFSTLDADKDTYLSQSEFAKWSAGGKSGGMPSSGADRNSSSSSPKTQSSDSPSAQ